jgi:hypothetical protein
MKMCLHLVRQGGAIEHLPMTRQNWETYVSDKTVARLWSHREDACVDPLEEFAERLRRRGYKPPPKMVSAAELSAAAAVEAAKHAPGQMSLFASTEERS